MKNFITIFCICLFASCDDWLDVKPENSITYSNYFEDETDLESVVTEIQAYVSIYLVNANERQMWLGLLADEWSDTYKSARRWEPDLGLMDGLGNPWKNYYDMIFLANMLLENSDGASGAVSRERLNFWNGQAYFAKALGYFMLSRQFGEAVITRNSTSLEAYGKSSALEVIDEAIRNARLALPLLPQYDGMRNVAGNTITSKQYGNQGSVAAALAHMYAWKGSLIELFHYEGSAADCYEAAIRYADTLISQQAGAYRLQADPEALCAALSSMGGANPESIYETELNPDAWIYPVCKIPGRVFVGWPVDKYARIEETKQRPFRIYRATVNEVFAAGDKRKPAYFYEAVEKDEAGRVTLNPLDSVYAYVIKWREGLYRVTNSGTTNEKFQCVRANQVVWRLADIYLLRAECHTKLGHEAAAAADLNVIRARAGAAAYPSAGDSQGLKFAVFRERERELFGEGHRFYDIVRNGMEYIKGYLGETFAQLPESDILNGALFMPVPEEAFTQNDLMRQNSYWRQYYN